MNKTALALGTLALLGFTQPASAMMCGPGQQAQPVQAQGGMCGMMGQAAQDDPMADKPAQQTQRGGMCPCCRNMAMMRGGGMMGGSGGGMQHHNMPGMETPKSQQ